MEQTTTTATHNARGGSGNDLYDLLHTAHPASTFRAILRQRIARREHVYRTQLEIALELSTQILRRETVEAVNDVVLVMTAAACLLGALWMWTN